MSSAAPKSVSQRTGSSPSIVRAPPGPSTANPWFWLVISVRAGGQVLDRVVGAVVAERQLVGLQADRAAEQLVAEADPVDRQPADAARGRCRRCSRARPGRPGRWRGTPRRGRPASSCVAAVGARVQRRRSRRAPRRFSRIERLTPVSIIAIRTVRAAAGPVGVQQHERPAGLTSRARSRPAIGGSAAISARASALGDRAGNTPPRIAPSSRMWRTSARVSRSVIAGMPCSVSQLSQPGSAPGASSRSTPARMIAARAWIAV